LDRTVYSTCYSGCYSVTDDDWGIQG